MTRFIDEHRDRFVVAEICRVLDWCESTYYAFKRRPPSDRALRDDWLMGEIRRVWEANYRVYGYRKVHAQLNREGIAVVAAFGHTLQGWASFGASPRTGWTVSLERASPNR